MGCNGQSMPPTFYEAVNSVSRKKFGFICVYPFDPWAEVFRILLSPRITRINTDKKTT